MRIIATLLLVLASDAAAQQRTVYGTDGRVTARAATDTQGTTTLYDSAGRVTARISGPPQGKPPATGTRSTGR